MILILGCSVFVACDKSGKADVVFDTVVSTSFDGLGVEWGVYEDVTKLAPNAQERTVAALNRLKPSLVRCMTNFDWIACNFDGKNTDDPSDDVWSYDFSNKYMQNCLQILDYCQDNGIKVAFGVWNIVGTTSGVEYVADGDNITAVESNSVDWNMYQDVTSDIRWAKLTVDLLDYLINQHGYTCIKWWVNSNEPNWTGAVGSSKNAYNTYEKWQQGVLNVRNALDEAGLTDVDIVGGDTTGLLGSADYLTQIATNIADVVDNYGVHMYISNYDIDSASYQSNIKQLFDGVKKIDDSLGKEKQMIIWEAGLLDGKNTTTDCNAYIANYSYGIRMADFTLQSILAGVNGVVYWDLDDAMHYMYTENGMTAKEWGMFSTLNSASALLQEYRPWFHSSVLLTNLLRPGNAVYSTKESSESIRTLATVTKDGLNGGFVAVNRAKEAVTKSFCLQTEVKNDSNKLFVYIFNEQNLRLGSDGFVVPNLVAEGNINDVITMEIPANSMVIVSSVEL